LLQYYQHFCDNNTYCELGGFSHSELTPRIGSVFQHCAVRYTVLLGLRQGFTVGQPLSHM